VSKERQIRTIFYDADGNRTEDSSKAVSAETVELDAAGRLIRKLEGGGLDWQVEEKSLEGDLGEISTRPSSENS
jgi:uncharacterized protein RhaS with RHS repeats